MRETGELGSPLGLVFHHLVPLGLLVPRLEAPMKCPRCRRDGYFPKMGRPKKIDSDRIERILALRKHGWSVTAISKHLGLSRTSIYTVLKNSAH